MSMRHEPVQALSASVMLELLEQGAGRHPIDRALLLLRHACPTQSFETLCEWTIGRRDAQVLELRRHTLGDRIEAYTECPACRNGLEFELSCASPPLRWPGASAATCPSSISTSGCLP
jgi:hypothetical protein